MFGELLDKWRSPTVSKGLDDLRPHGSHLNDIAFASQPAKLTVDASATRIWAQTPERPRALPTNDGDSITCARQKQDRASAFSAFPE